MESTREEEVVLELLEEATRRDKDYVINSLPIYGVVTGILTARTNEGYLNVDYPGNTGPKPLVARSVVACTDGDIGREVVLMFEKGDPSRPIIMGFVQSSPESATAPAQVLVDGETVTLTAKQEITLKCGKASITLTRSGKVLIRGAYLLSRSSGVNRIKGGSVQVN